MVVEHHPLGARLWTECNHADNPNPLVKLVQAERDIKAVYNVRHLDPLVEDLPPAYPMVVWRKSGGRAIQLTTRLWVLEDMHGTVRPLPVWSMLVVTLDFYAWLAALGDAKTAMGLT